MDAIVCSATIIFPTFTSWYGLIAVSLVADHVASTVTIVITVALAVFERKLRSRWSSPIG